MHSHTRSHKYLAASAYEIKTEKQSSIRATERKIRFRHTCTNTQYTHICQPRRPYVSFWLISATHNFFRSSFATLSSQLMYAMARRMCEKHSTKHTINGMAWHGMNVNAVKVKIALA